MQTFADIVNLWPSAADLARDVGVEEVTARAWRNRDSIPPDKWEALVAAGAARGFDAVSLETLARVARVCGERRAAKRELLAANRAA